MSARRCAPFDGPRRAGSRLVGSLHVSKKAAALGGLARHRHCGVSLARSAASAGKHPWCCSPGKVEEARTSQQGASQRSRRASAYAPPSHHVPARRSRNFRGRLLPAIHYPPIALSCSTLNHPLRLPLPCACNTERVRCCCFGTFLGRACSAAPNPLATNRPPPRPAPPTALHRGLRTLSATLPNTRFAPRAARGWILAARRCRSSLAEVAILC